MRFLLFGLLFFLCLGGCKNNSSKEVASAADVNVESKGSFDESTKKEQDSFIVADTFLLAFDDSAMVQVGFELESKEDIEWLENLNMEVSFDLNNRFPICFNPPKKVVSDSHYEIVISTNGVRPCTHTTYADGEYVWISDLDTGQRRRVRIVIATMIGKPGGE